MGSRIYRPVSIESNSACAEEPRLTDLFGTGGGIVFDSDEYDEYVETLNKLGANMQCIKTAEEIYARQQSAASAAKTKS